MRTIYIFVLFLLGGISNSQAQVYPAEAFVIRLELQILSATPTLSFDTNLLESYYAVNGGEYTYSIENYSATEDGDTSNIDNLPYSTLIDVTYVIEGDFNHIQNYFIYSTSGTRIKYNKGTVIQWGNRAWSSFAHAFNNFETVLLQDPLPPNLSNCTSMKAMFGKKLEGTSIVDWDVSNVTNMEALFSGNETFNQPIGNWNVANVTNMNHMFHVATFFNQPIGNWDVSNVMDMSAMFGSAENFNQPIGNWNVANVNSMNMMFDTARSFNQPIENWDVSNVMDMSRMFSYAESFNQPLGNWNVYNVTDMTGMFHITWAFNQPLNDWEFNPEVQFINQLYTNYSFIDNYFYSSENYDALLNRFVEIGLTDKQIRMENLTYCNALARNSLLAINNWDITGDQIGQECGSIYTISLPVRYDQDANGCDTVDPLINSEVQFYFYGSYTTYIVAATEETFQVNLPADNYVVFPNINELPIQFNPISSNITLADTSSDYQLSFCAE